MKVYYRQCKKCKKLKPYLTYFLSEEENKKLSEKDKLLCYDCKVELEKEDLTERERDKYSRTLKLIEGFIERKKKPGREKNKHLVIYDYRNRIAGR